MSKKRKIEFDDYNNDNWFFHGIDIKNRKLSIDGEIEPVEVSIMIRALTTMEQESGDPITVHINTPGGCVYSAMALYSRLRASRCEIHTVAEGMVASAGTWLMLAGDKRFSYPYTTFMWHSIASENPDNKLFAIKVDVAEVERIYSVMLNIYAERTPKKRSWWTKWIKYEDRYGDEELARDLGFVDHLILTSTIPPK